MLPLYLGIKLRTLYLHLRTTISKLTRSRKEVAIHKLTGTTALSSLSRKVIKLSTQPSLGWRLFGRTMQWLTSTLGLAPTDSQLKMGSGVGEHPSTMRLGVSRGAS